MRTMVCIRRCHGFRGGTWDEGEKVEVADGEDVPRHFITIDGYDDWKASKDSPKPRVDPMKPAPSISPVPAHLQGKGGISTVKPDNFRPAPASKKAGDDL